MSIQRSVLVFYSVIATGVFISSIKASNLENMKESLRNIPFGQSIAVNIANKRFNSNIANAGVAAGSQVLTELLKPKGDKTKEQDISKLLCLGSKYFVINTVVRTSVNWGTSSIQGPIIEQYNAMEKGLIKDAIGAAAPVVKELGYDLITTGIIALIKAASNFNPCDGSKSD